MTTISYSLNAQVLVLNKLWMAMRVVSAQRAFSLVYRQVAEVIHVGDGSFNGYDFSSWSDLSAHHHAFAVEPYDWVCTVRLRIAVPKVIRLLGYDRLPQQGVKLNRRNIFARDRSMCQYCGRRCSTSELSLDHLVPRRLGGQATGDNLVCCCVSCNARKGGRTPDQAQMVPLRKPFKPRRNPVLSLRLGSDKYACWQQFLDHAYWSVELK